MKSVARYVYRVYIETLEPSIRYCSVLYSMYRYQKTKCPKGVWSTLIITRNPNYLCSIPLIHLSTLTETSTKSALKCVCTKTRPERVSCVVHRLKCDLELKSSTTSLLEYFQGYLGI